MDEARGRGGDAGRRASHDAVPAIGDWVVQRTPRDPGATVPDDALRASGTSPGGPGVDAPRPGTSGDPPPWKAVVARRPASRETVAEKAGLEAAPVLAEGLRVLWDLSAERSALHARTLQGLAAFYDGDTAVGPGATDAIDAIGVGLALHCTVDQATRRVADAFLAVEHLPRTFAVLESGEMPAAWFDDVIRLVRPLAVADRRRADTVIATWDMRIPPERFRRELHHLVDWLSVRAAEPEREDPRACRSVTMLPDPQPGIGLLEVRGPAPEILLLARRLDAAARGLQNAQRHALAQGTEIPGDPEGRAASTGRPLSLSQLRFWLLTAAELDIDGVHVPADRFRLNVTVPVLTVLGASDQPGMLEGRIPIPPDMARHLAAGERTWHRVLTDPCTGAFLPMPAERYTPSPAMLEHLRLRQATCAVPGCDRPASSASECDHIQEFDHRDPARGGRTEIENLHLLCWQHHAEKTAGRLDPERLPSTGTGPGATAWRVGSAEHPCARVEVEDDVDLATPRAVAQLMASWNAYLARAEARRARRAEQEQDTTSDHAPDEPPTRPPREGPPWSEPRRGQPPPTDPHEAPPF